MSTKEKLIIPNSDYNKVTQIIQGYLTKNDEALDLDQISTRSGIQRDIITRNNGFLLSIGILTSGIKKKLSEQGKKLALAIEHSDGEEINRQWESIIHQASLLEPIIQMIKVQKKATKDKWESKILQALELQSGKRTGTGISCLLTILEKANFLEKDGKEYSISKAGTSSIQSDQNETDLGSQENTGKNTQNNDGVQQDNLAPLKGQPAVHIDIQIHISSDAKPEQIDQVFASMAKHLYNKK